MKKMLAILRMIKRLLLRAAYLASLVFIIPAMCFLALIARYVKKKYDVGMGPEPMINNVYFKMAFEKYGYSAQTFVNALYFITDSFDINYQRLYQTRVIARYAPFFVFTRCLFRYRCVYMYFNGVLGKDGWVFRELEPFLFRVAKVKTVVLGYGADFQDMYHCENLPFKHTLAQDYPGTRYGYTRIRNNIARWITKANHIIGSLEAVYYLPYWNTLVSNCFCVKDELFAEYEHDFFDASRPFRIFHAPNHTALKGTKFFQQAVDELREEGLNIELIMARGVSNDEILRQLRDCDVAADQLIIGWYGMFAIEGMASGKPVLCCLDPKIHELHVIAGTYDPQEMPLVACDPLTVKEAIRRLYMDRALAADIGKRSRAFARKYHSLAYVGGVFDRINRELGILPGEATPSDNREGMQHELV